MGSVNSCDFITPYGTSGVFNLVSKVGLEPTRPCGHQLLRLARLPVPPLRDKTKIDM